MLASFASLFAGLFITLGAIGGATLFVFAIGFLYGILNAYVVSTLWGWFVVPIFGLKALTVVQAWGLALIPSWFMYKTKSQEKVDKSNYVSVFANPLIAAGCWLLMGWILKHYI